jgi:hypothetical protein
MNRIKNTTLERKTTKEKKRFSIIKVDIVLLLTTNFFLLAASVIIYIIIYMYIKTPFLPLVAVTFCSPTSPWRGISPPTRR